MMLTTLAVINGLFAALTFLGLLAGDDLEDRAIATAFLTVFVFNVLICAGVIA